MPCRKKKCKTTVMQREHQQLWCFTTSAVNHTAVMAVTTAMTMAVTIGYYDGCYIGCYNGCYWHCAYQLQTLHSNLLEACSTSTYTICSVQTFDESIQTSYGPQNVKCIPTTCWASWDNQQNFSWALTHGMRLFSLNWKTSTNMSCWYTDCQNRNHRELLRSMYTWPKGMSMHERTNKQMIEWIESVQTSKQSYRLIESWGVGEYLEDCLVACQLIRQLGF